MDNANTAIVGNGIFFHYCHKTKGLMALRIHHPNCPLCMQKNPDYILNLLVHVVSNFATGSIVMIFANEVQAINYIQKHPLDNLMLGDAGYVDSK